MLASAPAALASAQPAPAPGSWSPTGSLATARSQGTATLLANGEVLVAGGQTSNGYLSSAELYDPTAGSWGPTTGPMTVARYQATATLLGNGKVLVAGGGNQFGLVQAADLYDPSTGTWSATGSLVTPRRLATATLLSNGKVLVAGGADSNGTDVAIAELYDPTTGTWSATGSMATPRTGATATLLPSGKVLVAGGINGGTLASAELYDPTTGNWSATGSMANARNGATATLLSDGKVLVAGGTGSTYLSSAELYDPTTGTWSATGSMATGRANATATVLPSGNVLVAGGYNGFASNAWLASSELYDPTSGSWSATGSLGTGRDNATAMLLSNGKVLVVGGQGSGYTSLASAELYTTLANPSLGSVGAPASGTVGSAISAGSVSASLSGGSSPSGTITFTVFGPQSSAPTDCSGGTTVATASVSGNGSYSPASDLTPSSAGNYWWFASYGGDSNNHPAASTCGPAMTETVVGQASPSLGSVGAPASGTVGSAISAGVVSASLSGGSSPTGTVTFKVFGPQSSAPTDCTAGGTTVGSASASDNGTYNPSSDFTPSSAGDYWWYASYGGDSNNNAASSACGDQMAETVVGSASPSLSLSAPSSATAGSALSASSVSATLSGGSSPSGTVTFTVYGPQSSAPTDCSSGGTNLGAATVSGNGSYNPPSDFTPSSAGDYWWFASYGGDSNNNSADSGCGDRMGETVVGTASPSLSLSAPASGTAGSAISASSVSLLMSGGASPSGAITFKVFGPASSAPSDCSTGGTTMGTQNMSGDGSYSPVSGFTPPTAGDYWWYATYGGDANNASADSGCGNQMAETVVSAPSAPQLSHLGILPASFSRAGRKVDGRCVAKTAKNSRDPSCTRPIRLAVSYQLDSAASVRITIGRLLPGRRSGGRCVAPTTKNHQQPSCTRLVELKGTLSQSGKQGANRFIFNGKVGGHTLGAGRYRLTATPSSNGSPGEPRSAAFTITG
jgi:N-acetylneuraminic acid mutarotase